MPEEEPFPTDPESFDMRSRSPIDWERDDWEQQAFALLHNYLYPDDQTEEETETREDILVYAGRGRLGDFFPGAEGSPAPGKGDGYVYGPQSGGESLDTYTVHRVTAKEPAEVADETVTLWQMRRGDLASVELKVGEDGHPKDITEDSEAYFHPFVIRDGGASLWWVMNAAVWIEKIQVGRAFDDTEALRPELVQLLRQAVKEGPFMRLTMEDGSQIDPNEPVCRQLLRTANELDGGARVARLAIGADNLEDLPTWTPPEEREDAPAPRPANQSASSAERNGFFPFASGAPSSVGMKAIRQAKHGWPEEDHAGRPKYPFTQERPHHVEGQFSIIVPDSNQAGGAVEAEMAQRVLEEFDRHTTRLHLACAAYSMKGDPAKYTSIPRQYVYDMLGMKWDQRSDLSRDEKDRQVEKAFRNLRKLGVQITVLDGPEGVPEQLGLESVWSLNTQKWGQKRINDSDRILDTEHWELLVRPNAWQQLYLNEEKGARQFGYFSRKLLENIDWHNNPAAGDLAIELLKYVRFQDGGKPRDLTVETMLGICGLGQAQKSYEQTRNRQKLERAILEQERWGWEIEWTRWPSAYRPDKEDRPSFPRGWWREGKKRDGWEDSFHEWKVTFYPPEDLAEMNSRAEEIDKSDPHELEAKGWDERIKAILNGTEYTQADLARILEVSPAAVSRWKSGDRTPGGPHRAGLHDIERRNGLRQD